MTQEQEELIKNDPLISILLEYKHPIRLIGGAVVDILEGRKPKDYDFISLPTTVIEKLQLDYLYDTKTATTYKKGEFTIQVLKTSVIDFDFLISSAEIRTDYYNKLSLLIDENSFNRKVLIPSPNSWLQKKNAINSLKRVPHWKKKGYTIRDETYLSLLNVISKSDKTNS